MDEIYKLIGQIIEVCQYIEAFLQTIVAMEPFITDPTFDGETIDGQPIENWIREHQEEFVDKWTDSFTSTMGTALNKASTLINLSENESNALKNVLKERNSIVHLYFKSTDFNTHFQNQSFMEHQSAYLKKRVTKMRNIFKQLKQKLYSEK